MGLILLPFSIWSSVHGEIKDITLAICLVALILVEIELHVHRQMLQVLNQEREDSIELRKVVDRQEKNIDSVLKLLRRWSFTGNGILIKLWPRLQFFSIFDIHMKLIENNF